MVNEGMVMRSLCCRVMKYKYIEVLKNAGLNEYVVLSTLVTLPPSF